MMYQTTRATTITAALIATMATVEAARTTTVFCPAKRLGKR
jgi:hypothetical protein